MWGCHLSQSGARTQLLEAGVSGRDVGVSPLPAWCQEAGPRGRGVWKRCVGVTSPRLAWCQDPGPRGRVTGGDVGVPPLPVWCQDPGARGRVAWKRCGGVTSSSLVPGPRSSRHGCLEEMWGCHLPQPGARTQELEAGVPGRVVWCDVGVSPLPAWPSARIQELEAGVTGRDVGVSPLPTWCQDPGARGRSASKRCGSVTSPNLAWCQEAGARGRGAWKRCGGVTSSSLVPGPRSSSQGCLEEMWGCHLSQPGARTQELEAGVAGRDVEVSPLPAWPGARTQELEAGVPGRDMGVSPLPAWCQDPGAGGRGAWKKCGGVPSPSRVPGPRSSRQGCLEEMWGCHLSQPGARTQELEAWVSGRNVGVSPLPAWPGADPGARGRGAWKRCGGVTSPSLAWCQEAGARGRGDWKRCGGVTSPSLVPGGRSPRQGCLEEMWGCHLSQPGARTQELEAGVAGRDVEPGARRQELEAGLSGRDVGVSPLPVWPGARTQELEAGMPGRDVGVSPLPAWPGARTQALEAGVPGRDVGVSPLPDWCQDPAARGRGAWKRCGGVTSPSLAWCQDPGAQGRGSWKRCVACFDVPSTEDTVRASVGGWHSM
ncbi:hypothetical protein NDU88_000074 [Pleurodeles waltl]|uniref:Uncharacterized protein n=1 Tax=Pleurodeles waltl TaxID=8319 RepID=A0AAV7MIN0_PLEWA|nr:hypothetical protein NDU88_000074 [Pleurodeles waltl]